jgi:hypothetical protein
LEGLAGDSLIVSSIDDSVIDAFLRLLPAVELRLETEVDEGALARRNDEYEGGLSDGRIGN